MVSVKGKYDGVAVIFDKPPVTYKCEVIVTFLDPPLLEKSVDDGTLAYLFKDYTDDGLREPLVDFGTAIGNRRLI